MSEGRPEPKAIGIKLRSRKKGIFLTAGLEATPNFGAVPSLFGVTLVHLPSGTPFCKTPEYDEAVEVASALEEATNWAYTDPKSQEAVAAQAIGVPIVHRIAEKWTDGTQPFLLLED